MNATAALPVGALMSSLLAAVIIFAIPERRRALRTTVNLAAATVKLMLVGVMVGSVFRGAQYEVHFGVLPGIDFVMQADALAVMFAGLSALLWLFTTIYAVGYLEDSPNRSRFFGFFSLCVSSTFGIAMAGNLFTFLVFYEMLTLSTYPLVVHRGTAEALQAGRKYLLYTLTGGLVLMVGVVWLHGVAGDLPFRAQGHFGAEAPASTETLAGIFFLLLGGLAVKAAVVPLHGWLPAAMVAPAPVSALLHAVAVVKAGAFGIIRVVYDVFGTRFVYREELLLPVQWLATVTILYGSLRALQQTSLKRRLAFSTISQLSYIVLGVSLMGPVGTAGALVHLIHQGLMKITLFFCAGNYAETAGVHRIDELNGLGRRMPVTTVAFTVGALGMIGVPPMAGFVSKWTLGSGALAAGMDWGVAVLLASSLLNAAYFLPLLQRLWFESSPDQGRATSQTGRLEPETSRWLLWPPILTAASTVLVGVMAGLPFSPLSWAELIALREFGP
jgi:multicomponent Na+:H+ antiporter subunit D